MGLGVEGHLCAGFRRNMVGLFSLRQRVLGGQERGVRVVAKVPARSVRLRYHYWSLSMGHIPNTEAGGSNRPGNDYRFFLCLVDFLDSPRPDRYLMYMEISTLFASRTVFGNCSVVCSERRANGDDAIIWSNSKNARAKRCTTKI